MLKDIQGNYIITKDDVMYYQVNNQKKLDKDLNLVSM